jgi:hypothetical protein
MMDVRKAHDLGRAETEKMIAEEARLSAARVVAGTPVPYVGTVYDGNNVVGYCRVWNGVAIPGSFRHTVEALPPAVYG